MVGLATFDCRLGEAFCFTLPEYTFLGNEMLIYANNNLSRDGKIGVIIADTDLDFQNIAARLGFAAAEEKRTVL